MRCFTIRSNAHITCMLNGLRPISNIVMYSYLTITHMFMFNLLTGIFTMNIIITNFTNVNSIRYQ